MNEKAFLESENEEEQQEDNVINAMIPPANPIISKHFPSMDEKVSMKIDSSSLSHEDTNTIKYRNILIEK